MTTAAIKKRKPRGQKTVGCSTARLELANQVLSSFVKARIEQRPGFPHFVVCWTSFGKEVRKRWMTRGQDFYPVWKHDYPGGGTSSTALSQLIRWLQGKPVLPIESWRYWASETCKLLPRSAVETLLAGGYPEFADCVLCHQRIEGGLDWWSLKGVSGPCCGRTSGCRQQVRQ